MAAKPSESQLKELIQRFSDEGRSKEQIYKMFVKKGWIDRDEELEKSFEAQVPEDSPEGEIINGGEEDNPSDFISQARGEDWDINTGQEKLKIFADEYNQILKDAAAHVNKYSHGEGLVGKGTEEFNKTLDEYKKKLEELETSPEFTQLMKDIAKGGTGKMFDNGIMNADINQTLKMATAGLGSKMFNDKDRVGNYLAEYATSGAGKFVDELASSGGMWNALGIAPGLIKSIFAGEDAQDIAKEYLKNNNVKANDKTEKKDKTDFYGPADKMKFGSDINGTEGEGYLDKRNDELAAHLKKKGITSAEDIDTFLSKYASWANAKPEWKENTLNELTKRLEKSSPKKEDSDKKDKKDKEAFDKDSWVWKTDEDGYWNPDNDSPINGVEENDKGGKGNVKEKEEQTPENNKYLYINETLKNIKSNKDRIDYLKKHGFTVDKTGFYTKNGMKTKVYKDGQYNPKYVKPDKKEGYNDRTKVEPSKDNDLQIALQESGYQGPRDANGNFLPITDEWLDLHENLKDKSKK